MPAKTFWRCSVCGDIHYGVAGPDECPTCHQLKKYLSIAAAEAGKLMNLPENKTASGGLTDAV